MSESMIPAEATTVISAEVSTAWTDRAFSWRKYECSIPIVSFGSSEEKEMPISLRRVIDPGATASSAVPTTMLGNRHRIAE